MKRLLLLSGMVLTAVLAMASGAQAHGDAAAECNGTATGLTIRGDLVVPSGGSCFPVAVRAVMASTMPAFTRLKVRDKPLHVRTPRE